VVSTSRSATALYSTQWRAGGQAVHDHCVSVDPSAAQRNEARVKCKYARAAECSSLCSSSRLLADWLVACFFRRFVAPAAARRPAADYAARGSVTGRDVNNALSHIQTKMHHASQQPPVVSRGFASSHLVVVDALRYCEREFWFLHFLALVQKKLMCRLCFVTMRFLSPFIGNGFTIKRASKKLTCICSSNFFEESLAPRVYESGEPFLQFKCKPRFAVKCNLVKHSIQK
jgi:hypothetical protein